MSTGRYTRKLSGSNKKFGRCRVEGHAQWCEVSVDIQSEVVKRSVERTKHLNEEFDLMLQDEIYDKQNEDQKYG